MRAVGCRLATAAAASRLPPATLSAASRVPLRCFSTVPRKANTTDINLDALRARQPKQLLQTDIFSAVPPQDIVAVDLADMASSAVMTNPARVLSIYRRHVSNGDAPDAAVLVRGFTQLGFLFDPNSFFSSADRQKLTSHRTFRSLAHDLCGVMGDVPDASAPTLLYAMACLEYRCPPLLPRLLDAVERHLRAWRTEVLTLALHSAAALGLGRARLGRPDKIVFEFKDGIDSRDYSRTCDKIAEELLERLVRDASEEDPQAAEGCSVQDWSRAAFAVCMAGLYDFGGKTGTFLLPLLVARACEQVHQTEELDGSGWAQFFLYQTLYAVDVEKPKCEADVKRATPMWIQERLHHRWLDSIVLQAQPQGADEMQRDVDRALRRTNTQALLNCSFGRPWDEQHCWFAGFRLEPQVALECDSMLPLGPGRPRPSGWLAMKSRMLQKMGFKVATLHKCFWEGLSEDQKDEQLMQLRVEVNYRHSKELERRQKKIRQTPHTYAGVESRKSDWSYSPPSEEAGAQASARA